MHALSATGAQALQAAFRLAAAAEWGYPYAMGDERSAKTQGKDRGRAERLAKALRENLKRRKAQVRDRGRETRPAARLPDDDSQP